mmetsp:Transcript_64426/g.197070  ORF Transcript_64426/g.197070 Transcript_64426/m.197070 type:complete len:215 (+) Transcript_64426:661-1305(+)
MTNCLHPRLQRLELLALRRPRVRELLHDRRLFQLAPALSDMVPLQRLLQSFHLPLASLELLDAVAVMLWLGLVPYLGVPVEHLTDVRQEAEVDAVELEAKLRDGGLPSKRIDERPARDFAERIVAQVQRLQGCVVGQSVREGPACLVGHVAGAKVQHPQARAPRAVPTSEHAAQGSRGRRADLVAAQRQGLQCRVEHEGLGQAQHSLVRQVAIR